METLKVVRKTFTMLSEKRTQVLDITKQIRDIVLGADIKEGIILVNSLHTTCALFVNEFQGALVEDLKTMMDRLLSLGRFQSILFAELDGPRPRSIDIQIMGVGPVGGE